MTSRQAFVFDVNRCTGCHACEMACQIANSLPAGRRWREVRTFNELHVPQVELVHLSMACNHCREAPCMQQCPALAYSRDATTGAVLINAAACLGCGYCAWACPYDAPRLDETRGVMTKCTLCNDKVLDGGLPACVVGCPTGALDWRRVAAAELTQDVPGFVQAGTEPGFRVEGVRPERCVPLQTAPPALPPWQDLRARLLPRITLVHEWSLAVFTFLAALLVGALAASQWGGPRPDWRLFLGAGVLGMGLSASHLGQGRRAWRAPLHVSRSWLSREVVLFAGFLGLGTLTLGAWTGLHLAGWSGPLAVGLGALLLLAIDRVYNVARIRGAGAWHSAHVLGTGLFLASIWSQTMPLVLTMAALKCALFIVRQASRRAQGLAAPAGLAAPRLGLLVLGVGGLLLAKGGLAPVILIMAGEAIDRGLYYQELEIPTPDSLQFDELAARPAAHGVCTRTEPRF